MIENYALFGYGKTQNFITSGFLMVSITIISLIGSKNFSLVPAASDVLGGLSLAMLVMMLTLRSLRGGDMGEAPRDADHR